MTKGSCRLLLALCFVGMMCLTSKLTASDARETYLINMLENGRNYRLRVQAATTLGKLRSKEALTALVRALGDEHELVVISATAALEQIGDTSVISDLEDAFLKSKSTAVKSQIESTLRVLKALSVDNEGTAAVSSKPRFLVRVDPMGNSSGMLNEDIAKKLRDEVINRVSREPGVVMQQPGLSLQAVSKKIKEEKLGGYILSGSVLKIERVDNQIVMKIGLNVFTNPGYTLLMMPTAQGALSITPGDNTEDTERKARERTMKSIVSNLVSTVFDELRQMKNP